MRFIVVLLVFALGIYPARSRGQATGATKVSLPQEVSSSEPQKTGQAPSSARDYSAESLIIEKLDTVYRYRADSTGSREITAVARIQSDGAARQYGVLSVPFAGDSQKVEYDYLRVRKPDGTLVETPVSDAQEMPQQVTREAPFYSDLKEKQLPVRNLQPGDRLEYRARIVDTKAEVPGHFWGQDTFRSATVILNESIELHAPRGTYVKVWSPELPPLKSETSDEVVYRWTGSQPDPTVGNDGKAIQREVDPKGELAQIAWTTFKSWDEVAGWYHSLEADRITPDSAVKTKADELTAGKSTPTEKAQALYSYVATQIRYIGVAFGIGRYQPHMAAEVLRNQYGDCKDKHTLLAAMLTAEGFHPEGVLVGAGIRMNEEVPSPAAFNHMITVVSVDGKQTWLDATAELAPYRMLVPLIRDKPVLVVTPTGQAAMERTPAELPFTSFSNFAGTGTLAKDGTMKAKIEFTERGDDELVLRSLLRQVPRGQWNELMQRLSQGFGFGGITSNPDAGSPEKTTEPVRFNYDYVREKTGDWDNHRILPLFPIVFLPSIDEKNPPKEQPIRLGEPRLEESLSTITLPEGWGAVPPESVHEKTTFASFDKTYKVEGQKLIVERKVQIFQREVPAAEWKSYKKWLDATVSNGESFISLISTESKPEGKEAATESAAKPDVNGLVRQAFEQMQRGEINAAEITIRQIRQADPDSPSGYRGLIQLQTMRGQIDDAAKTTQEFLRESFVTNADRNAAITLFMYRHRYADALPLLEKAAAANPDSTAVQIQLGRAQMRTGHQETAKATLIAALTRTADPAILNEGADELAEGSLALDIAESSARKAIEMLTPESAGWVMTDIPNEQRDGRF
jgi:hypothetical protein